MLRLLIFVAGILTLYVDARNIEDSADPSHLQTTSILALVPSIRSFQAISVRISSSASTEQLHSRLCSTSSFSAPLRSRLKYSYPSLVTLLDPRSVDRPSASCSPASCSGSSSPEFSPESSQTLAVCATSTL